MSSSTHSRVQSRPIRKIISIDKEIKSHVDEALRSDGPTQHLTEVDREWYNIRIGDLEAKLKRLQNECQQHQKEKAAAKEVLDKSTSDFKDIISFLQQSLQLRDDQCLEFKERLKGLQNARDEEGNDYKSRIKTLETEKENLEQRMLSEIKLLQGKLTSLEEFRIEKDAFTLRFQALEKLLKEKEEEIPLQLDRKERQTVLQIEALKEKHALELEELSQDLEAGAVSKLTAASRRALEENTMLLRQVASIGAKLALNESQLTTVKCQNQGLKSLLKKMENKLKAAQQESRDKNINRKVQDGMEILLRKKAQQYEQLELIEMKMRTENQMLQKEISQMESDRTEQLNRISELTDIVENMKTINVQTSSKIAILTEAVQSAKEIMAAFISMEDHVDIMDQVMNFIQTDFHS